MRPEPTDDDHPTAPVPTGAGPARADGRRPDDGAVVNPAHPDGPSTGDCRTLAGRFSEIINVIPSGALSDPAVRRLRALQKGYRSLGRV